jgi:glycosyltransferase involved in cell wall biosynthesis
VPAVDVLLPTGGRSHTIGYSIRSVLAQTHEDLRLHVVADGCDVETAVREAAGGDPRVDYVSLPKAKGFGYANRNEVLKRTAAPVVAYITDDDLWFADHLEIGLSQLSRRGAGLVALRSVHVDPRGALDPHFFAYEWPLRLHRRPIRDWFVGSSNMVHARALFDRIGFWNAKLPRFGDREFYQRAIDADEGVYLDCATTLRFYALHWDRRYSRRKEPPQAGFLPRIADPRWIAEVRDRAGAPGRGLGVRVRQVGDFLRFARRSGPRWLRHLATGLTGRRAAA